VDHGSRPGAGILLAFSLVFFLRSRGTERGGTDGTGAAFWDPPLSLGVDAPAYIDRFLDFLNASGLTQSLSSR
jgi:hypothetical protein